MSTENVKSEPGKVFIKTEDGEIQEFAEVKELKCIETLEEKDDPATDIRNYGIGTAVSGNLEFSCTLTKDASRRFQKMLGIQKIKRKRFIKLLMGCGIQKNAATQFANIVHKAMGHYTPMTVQRIIEWLIIQTEEARKRSENRENKETRETVSKQV